MVDLDQLSTRSLADPPAAPLSMGELENRARRRRRRRRGVAGSVVAVMLLAGAAAGVRAWMPSNDASTDVATAGAEDERGGEPNGAAAMEPCGPVVLGDDPNVNELERAGVPDSVPAFLVEQFEMRGASCLDAGDGSRLWVEGVMVGFWSGDTMVARWFVPGVPASTGYSGRDYLESLEGGGDVRELGDGFLSVLPSDHAEAIRSELERVGPSDFVSLWAEIVAQR
jgi:hypothetical protein